MTLLGGLLRAAAEGFGLARDLARAGRDPVVEIQRIRVAEQRRAAEATWGQKLDERFGADRSATDGYELYGELDQLTEAQQDLLLDVLVEVVAQRPNGAQRAKR